MKMMSKQRLHPAAMIFNLFTSVRHSYFFIIVSLVAIKGHSTFYFTIALTTIIILLLVYSFITWYRFTYQIKEDELQIKQGLFIRKERYISRNRIQSIDLTATVIHRLFKL